MLKLKKIAVTGGIASGKSSVCRLFEECGAYVVQADNIVHQLLSPDTDVGKKVISLLGREIVVNNQISRQAIAQKVFRNPMLLKNLEQLLHPEVQKEIESQYQIISKNQHFKLFIAEIPLLFETQLEAFYDLTITVVADSEIAKQRFLAKQDYYDEDEFWHRSQRQLPTEEKAKRADIVIENNGSFEDLRASVEKIYQQLVN